MKQQSRTIRVAVYGTLLEGERNAHLASDAHSRHPCTLTGTLYDTGYGFPAFVPEGSTPVRAELLAVSTETFARLDRLEGYPNLYTRQKISVHVSGCIQTAWVYIMNRLPKEATVIVGGDWRGR